MSVPTTSSRSSSKKDIRGEDERRSNWKTSMVCCGSNAMNQLCSSDPLELMRSSFQPLDRNKFKRKDKSLKNPCLVSVGANSSIAVFEEAPHECYVWGEGFNSTVSKSPIVYSIHEKKSIIQVSCGHSHAGLITDDGKVFTWGQGEHGKLGHGSKQNVLNPKLVEKLTSQVALQISCGGSHTAIIASPPELIFYVSASSLRSHGSSSSGKDALSFDDKLMKCGKLYMCGLNKAGQLGIGDSLAQVTSSKPLMRSSSNRSSSYSIPTLVNHFDNEDLVVADVSCGLHHTLVVATSSYRLENHRSMFVFSFGFGDHGRLGLGDEDQRDYPCKVKLPVGFNAIQVSAGEHHSLCRGIDSCYSWGNNSMGQLGAGNPSSLDQALEPVPVIVPEALRIMSLVAGARHSGAITDCGKVLLWGWGEEGQLGQGTEKNSYLPRPSKLPRCDGVIGVPHSIHLGSTHTLIVCYNLQFTQNDEENDEEEMETPTLEPMKPTTEEKKDSVILAEPVPEPKLEDNNIEEVPIPVIQPKSVLLISDDETILLTQRGIKDIEPSPKPIQSLRDLLAMRDVRESREESNHSSNDGASCDQSEANDADDIQMIQESEGLVSRENEECIDNPIPLPNPTKDIDIPLSRVLVSETSDYIDTNTIIQQKLQVAHDESNDNVTQKAPQHIEEKVDVFYRPGQDMEKCFVANSAKRAELRKAKAFDSTPNPSTTTATSSKRNNHKSFRV